MLLNSLRDVWGSVKGRRKAKRRDPAMDDIDRIMKRCDVEDVRNALNLNLNNLKAEATCCVCLVRPATVRTLPCYHVSMCRRCCLTMIRALIVDEEPFVNCILCRRVVHRFVYNKLNYLQELDPFAYENIFP